MRAARPRKSGAAKRDQAEITAAPSGSRSTDEAVFFDPAQTSTSIIAGKITLRAIVRTLILEQGMYGITIGPFAASDSPLLGVTLPAIEISSLSDADRGSVRVLTGSGAVPSWVGPEGGTVLVEAPAGGAPVSLTTYLPREEDPVPLDIRVERFDHQPST